MTKATRGWSWSEKLFPRRRFESDFPLVLWFAGLWLYLKSFLYVCYLYMIGVEPPPYSLATKVEIAYFALAFVPSFLLGLALWREKKAAVNLAIAFLIVDTPLLLFHVMRLSEAGFLDTGLTWLLEFGSLAVNAIALVWLIGYRMGGETT
ncbi:MAG: hypothetical protein P8182_00100 [Deltaproteobacteria bacterium]